MARAKTRSKSVVCHVTDAGDVVHKAMVRRTVSYDGNKVVVFMVNLACTPRTVTWDAKQHPDMKSWADLPEGFALPKLLTDAGLLVKYEPESLIAPAVTCMVCSTLEWA